MKIKKPSLKGMKNCGYLGHFAKEKYLCAGHNFSGKMKLSGGKQEVMGPPEVMGPEEPKPEKVSFSEPMDVSMSQEKRSQVDAQIRRQIKNMQAVEKIKEQVADVADRDRRLAPELERRLRMRAKMKARGDY